MQAITVFKYLFPLLALLALSPLASGNVFDARLQNLVGEEVAMRQFSGKPLVVNFWAPWCPPCRKEIPTFAEFYREKGEQVTVVGIVMDYDNLQEIQEIQSQHKVSYPFLIVPEQEEKHFSKIRGLPTTLFIGKDGVIQKTHFGLVHTQDLLDFLAREYPEKTKAQTAQETSHDQPEKI